MSDMIESLERFTLIYTLIRGSEFFFKGGRCERASVYFSDRQAIASSWLRPRGLLEWFSILIG